MKRICFVLRSHPSLDMGGAELQSYIIAEELAQRGWDVHFVSENRGWDLDTNLENGIITLHWINERGTAHGLANYLQLAMILKAIRPDIIYQRMALDYTGIVKHIANRYKCKFVWASSSDKDCQKRRYRELLNNSNSSLKKLAKYSLLAACDCLISYGIAGADEVIVQSRQQQELLQEHFGKAARIVKNGFPLPELPTNKPPTPTIVWVANVKPLKRVDLFIELSKRCQDLPAKFIVIGGDPKLQVDTLLSQQQTKNVTFMGPLAQHQVEAVMDKAHLLVNTSDYEGFPNTFIQAWMRSMPVVTLNVDPDNVIKDHNLGFHSGSFQKMLNDVRSLIIDSELRNRMGANARQYAVKKHDIRVTGTSFETILLSLV